MQQVIRDKIEVLRLLQLTDNVDVSAKISVLEELLAEILIEENAATAKKFGFPVISITENNEPELYYRLFDRDYQVEAFIEQATVL